MESGPALIPADAHAAIAAIVASIPFAALYQIVREANGTTYFTYFGEGVTEILGVTPEEIYANPTLPQDLVHPADIPRFLSAWETSIRDIAPFQVIVRQRHRTRGLRWSLLRSVPVRAADGRMTWNGLQVDVTDQLADLEPEPLEAGETLRVCAWCTRFFGADQVWHPTRDLLNLFSQNRITHGLCPECHDQFLER